MEDLIALRATTDTGATAYFLTWGRIQDPVDPGEVEAIVLHASTAFKTPGAVVRVEVCPSLQEASDAPLFYEGLFHFSQRPIPFGDGYGSWRDEIDVRMRRGLDIFSVGPFE